MPPVLGLILGSLLTAVGLALLVVAVLGSRGRLPRNRFAGVRTAATMASGNAFVQGNRVAAPLVGAAGAVALAGGGALLAGATGFLGWLLLGLTGVAVLVLVGIGGALGDRVARLTAVADEPAPCAGSCLGCDLVAGCRPTAATAEPGPAV